MLSCAPAGPFGPAEIRKRRSGLAMAEQAQDGGGEWQRDPLPFRRVMVRWTLGFWAGIYILFTLRSTALPYDMLIEQGMLRVVMMGVGLLLCTFLYLLLERLDLEEIPRKILPIAGAAMTAVLIYWVTAYYVFYVLPGLWEADRGPIATIGLYITQFFWVFPAWIGLYYWLRRKSEKAAQRDSGPHIETLWIKGRGGAARVPVDQIHWLEAEGDYVRVHTAERSHLMRATMRNLEEALDPHRFVRIHRRVIAPVDLICAIERHRDSRVDVRLSTGITLPAGRHYLPRLKEIGRAA